jgi:hypothetical protein
MPLCANLAGDLERMAKNTVKAMNETTHGYPCEPERV